MPDLFKEIIPSILQTKKSVINDDIDAKDYVPFVVNRALSYHIDCVLYANEMNMRAQAPVKWQFDFLKNSIPKKKRFSKWHKKEATTDQIKLVMKHYKYSEKRAIEALSIMSAKQIMELQQSYDHGGRN